MNSTEHQPAANSVLIIGGSGFVGTRVVGLLKDDGREVVIGDLQTSAAFPDLSRHCDVRDLGSLKQAIGGTDAIINLAAEHRDDVRPVSRYYETNVQGAERVCRAARECGAQKIIFTSSVAVYGFQPRPVDEAGPFAPFNEYGKTKLQAEEVYRAWAEEDQSRTLVIIRPTVIFGEGNRGNVYNLIRQIASGRFVMVGAGENVKSIAYVENVAAFIAYTLRFPSGIHVFNYVDGPDMKTRELVECVSQCLGRPNKPRTIPKATALAAGYVFDLAARVSGRTFPISAVRVRKFCETTQFRSERVRESGFTAPVSLAEGLANTIRVDFLQHEAVSPRRSSTDQSCNSPENRESAFRSSRL